ncbi:MAG: endolytic transglycosylase MltG, partial [Rhodomicrobium sp.]|nr:endolytic transglycosylase MltG [Rhodomicrobium sp.]
VLNPDKSSDLFFVADGTGGHTFAESFADHQRNVAKWRTIEKEQRENSKQQASPSSGWTSTTLDKLQAVEIPLPQRNPRH